MIKIIMHTPIFVWPLLAYLLFIGLKARKTSTISLKTVYIIPTIFLAWSLYSVLARHNSNLLILILWTASMAIGLVVGLIITRNLNMHFDKKNNLIGLPGSIIPLTLYMSIFFTKYFLGVASSLHAELKESWILLIPEFITVIITGVFVGKSLMILQKFKAAPRVRTNNENP